MEDQHRAMERETIEAKEESEDQHRVMEREATEAEATGRAVEIQNAEGCTARHGKASRQRDHSKGERKSKKEDEAEEAEVAKVAKEINQENDPETQFKIRDQDQDMQLAHMKMTQNIKTVGLGLSKARE